MRSSATRRDPPAKPRKPRNDASTKNTAVVDARAEDATKKPRGPAFFNEAFFGEDETLAPVAVAGGGQTTQPEPPTPSPWRPSDDRGEWDVKPSVDYRFVAKKPRVEVTPATMGFDEEGQGSLGTSVQLMALGPQNYFLDINPQTSFFKQVYHRHTEFAIECFDDPVSLALGTTTVIEIPRRGDMLGDVILEVSLSTPPGYAPTTWVDAVGYVLFTRARLIVDDLVIHDHERLVYDLVDKLFLPHGRKLAVDEMIGRGRTMATDTQHTVFLPFKFFCCTGHASSRQFMPLASLARTAKMTLELTTEPLAGLTVSGVARAHTLQAKLLTEQVFVEREERRVAMFKPCRQLVEQYQDVDALSYSFDDSGSFDLQQVRLDLRELNLPVKCLAFVAYDENATGANRYFEYLDCVDLATLYINGNERFLPRTGRYFSLVQTYQHAGRCVPDLVHLYSFALEAYNRQPSGALNFAVLDNPHLLVGLRNTQGRAVKIKAFAICYNWLVAQNGGISFAFT